MISYQTLQGTPMEAAAWSKNVKMSTWKFCYRRLLHPSLDFKENSSLMKLVVSGSRVLEQITPGMGKPCWGMLPPPESVHTLRRNPKKINLRFCAESGVKIPESGGGHVSLEWGDVQIQPWDPPEVSQLCTARSPPCGYFTTLCRLFWNTLPSNHATHKVAEN